MALRPPLPLRRKLPRHHHLLPPPQSSRRPLHLSRSSHLQPLPRKKTNPMSAPRPWSASLPANTTWISPKSVAPVPAVASPSRTFSTSLNAALQLQRLRPLHPPEPRQRRPPPSSPAISFPSDP